MLENFKYQDEFINYKKHYEQSIFLDIETSGVRRYKDFAWVIGIGYIHNKNIITKQLFCNDISDEKDSLIQLSETMNTFQEIITYNGNSFDLPFLSERAAINEISLEFPEKKLDLYRYVRSNNKFLMLRDISLQGIEKYLGVNRSDFLSGRDTMKLYDISVKTNNEELKKSLLKHNYYDVRNLPEILKIIDTVNELRTISNIYIIKHLFKVKDRLIVVLTNPLNLSNIHIYTEHYTIESRNNNIFLLLNIKQTTYNKKSIYYLTGNGRTIYYDRLLYKIIKEEITKIIKINFN